MKRFTWRSLAIGAWGFLWLSLGFIGCQKEQPTEVIEVKDPEPYIDSKGQYRVPTWMTFVGKVAFDDVVFESTSSETVLLPKQHWLIDELFLAKSASTATCQAEYWFKQDSDFTLTEGSNFYYFILEELCSGSYQWTHGLIATTKGSSFTNSVQLVSHHREMQSIGGGVCETVVSDYKSWTSADQTWYSGHQFDTFSTWTNNFDSDCYGTNLIHGGTVALVSGGSTGSATFDFIILKAWSD